MTAGITVLVARAGAGEGPLAPSDPLLTTATELAQSLGAEVGLWTSVGAEDEYSLMAAATDLASCVQKRDCRLVLLPDDDSGRRLALLAASALGTAALLGCSDVVARAGAVVYVRPVHGGWLEQEVVYAPGYIQVATLALPAEAALSPPAELVFHEVARLESAVGIHGLPQGSSESRVRRLEFLPPDPRSVDLAHAQCIVAAGAGSGRGALLATVQRLAELLAGSVGATRPVVDEGLLPRERLIGRTGRTVSPELYLALGISGSPHHLAGVAKAERVFAVNRDPHAPIFQFADLGFVGDLETVLPALVEKIEEWRETRSEAGGDG